MRRIAVVTSHPIQYQAPWFRALAAVCDLTVFFGHRQDAAGQARAGFGQGFEWDVPLLDGYRYHWLTNVSAMPGVESFRECDTPGIKSLLADGRFDACIVNGWYLKSYVQAIRACRALGLPVLVRGDSQLTGPRSALKSAAKYLPYRFLLQRMHAHLYVGRRNYAYLRHYGVPAAKLFFAPHFVENDRFATGARHARSSGEAARLRASWAATGATTVFLFAGKFIDKKRPADVIDAVAALAHEGRDVRAVFVGSGPDEAGLRARAARISAPVYFEGFQNQSHIASWYAAANWLVLPSDGRETWGLVVNEAMASGLPAIVSDAVGCGPDLINEGVTGFTYPVGDAAGLADRMRLATAWPGTPDAHRAVLARVAQYSCEAAVGGTLQAIEFVAGRAPREAGAVADEQHA